MALATYTSGEPMSARAVTAGRSPNAVDPLPGAVTRAGIELVAWTAVPWAFAARGSWPAAAIALAVLVALPATFNVAGDKHRDGHIVSGRVRIGIELLLAAAALLGAWWAWPVPIAVAVTVLACGFLLLGVPRWRQGRAEQPAERAGPTLGEP